MSVKVMVALSNGILSEGVKKLLEGSGGVKVEGILETGSDPYPIIRSSGPDVILVDFMTLYNGFGEIGAKHDMKLILLDTGCGQENISSAIASRGLKGVMAKNSTAECLKKAIKTVAEGGTCFEGLAGACCKRSAAERGKKLG